MVEPYDGETYVAFLDISGFKKKVINDIDLAARILDEFYGTMYSVCSDMSYRARANSSNKMKLPGVNVIVVSDCAVIFTRNVDHIEDMVNSLEAILQFITKVNHHLIFFDSPPILTTCSIAYGRFIYETKNEFDDLRKNCFLGMPYMSAYMDNEDLKSRPGSCRLLKENMNLPRKLPKRKPFTLLDLHDKYYCFHWMLNSRKYLKDFERAYEEACQLEEPLKYEGIALVLQKYIGNPGF